MNKKLKRSKKILIIVSILFTIMIIILAAYGGCKFFLRNELIRMINYYSENNNYQIVYGNFEEILDFNENRDYTIQCHIIIDKERCIADYGEDITSSHQRLAIINSNYKILKDNGFFDLNLEEENNIRFIISSKIWSSSWALPIVGIAIDDNVYLDFEEGKANYLNFLKYDLNGNG